MGSLPADMIFLVAQFFVRPVDLLNLGLVCQRFHHVIFQASPGSSGQAPPSRASVLSSTTTVFPTMIPAASEPTSSSALTKAALMQFRWMSHFVKEEIILEWDWKLYHMVVHLAQEVNKIRHGLTKTYMIVKWVEVGEKNRKNQIRIQGREEKAWWMAMIKRGSVLLHEMSFVNGTRHGDELVYVDTMGKPLPRTLTVRWYNGRKQPTTAPSAS